jgi:hypothetical protein
MAPRMCSSLIHTQVSLFFIICLKYRSWRNVRHRHYVTQIQETITKFTQMNCALLYEVWAKEWTNSYWGRAIAQVVNRRLPTTAARVRAQVSSCGICGGQSGAGAGFLLILRFPLPILIPPTDPHSSSIIRGWYNGPVSGRDTKWTQSHRTPKTKKTILLLKTLEPCANTSSSMGTFWYLASARYRWECNCISSIYNEHHVIIVTSCVSHNSCILTQVTSFLFVRHLLK